MWKRTKKSREGGLPGAQIRGCKANIRESDSLLRSVNNALAFSLHECPRGKYITQTQVNPSYKKPKRVEVTTLNVACKACKRSCATTVNPSRPNQE